MLGVSRDDVLYVLGVSIRLHTFGSRLTRTMRGRHTFSALRPCGHQDLFSRNPLHLWVPKSVFRPRSIIYWFSRREMNAMGIVIQFPAHPLPHSNSICSIKALRPQHGFRAENIQLRSGQVSSRILVGTTCPSSVVDTRIYVRQGFASEIVSPEIPHCI